MLSTRCFPVVAVAVSFAAVIGWAGDWPTYRYDAQRSGATPDSLPTKLALRWTRQLPEYQLAFPNEERQQFDGSHEPVCLDGILVVGCPADGSVRAFAADTGGELWRFYAEGPVRLAPALSAGRVLFGADDGRFYCLDLASGKLLWKRTVYPAGRPDLRLLGNNRLVSLWPVRGGPLVIGDVVYFGAGVWPTLGVCAQALDLRTGELRWQNGQLSYLTGVRIDHNMRYDAGISPQGYLSAAGDHLLIPNGRSHPAALNSNDGSLFHFVQGYRNGHCRVVVGGGYAFVGPNGVLSTIDFREVGSKWQAAGKNAPKAFDARKFDLYEGPYHPYKKFSGCNADSVFAGTTAYSLVDGVFYAHDLSDSGVSEYEINQGSAQLKPFRWDARMTRRVAIGLKGKTRLFAKAGNRLYGRAGNQVLALELREGSPAVELAWSVKTSALPTSMIAAQDRLFVALEDGSLLCFGEPDKPEPGVLTETVAKPAASLSAERQAIFTGEGIAVVLGAMSPAEIEYVLANSAFRLLLVSRDREAVDGARRRLAAAGVYGRRTECFSGDPLAFCLPAYLASSLWLRGRDLGIPTTEQLAKIWHSVHPYGGVLWYTGTPAQCADFSRRAKSAQLPGAQIAASESMVKITRPDGPPDAANWTHETADAARSHYSHDRAVRAPLAPLWYGDGVDYGFIKRKDYGRGVKPQVVDGRVFALQQFSGTLFAYDAYTGRRLWSVLSDGGDKRFITRFASFPNGVYAAGKGRCVVYDPATGKERFRMNFAGAAGEGKPARATAVVVSEASVLIAVSAIDTVAIEGGLWDADTLVCFDRETGKERWRRSARFRFNTKALAVGAGRIFCTDSRSPVEKAVSERRGAAPETCTSVVWALDEMSGKECWQHQHRSSYHKYGASSWLSTRTKDDWLAYCVTTKQVLAGRDSNSLLLDAATGEVVWEKQLGLYQPIIVMEDHFYDQKGRLVELATGKTIKSGIFRRGGCNYAVANPHLAFLRDQTVSYVDLESGKKYRLRNMRSGCSNSLIPASGLLNIPNFSQGCVCNYPVQTSSAWIHYPELAEWDSPAPTELTPLLKETGIPRLTSETVGDMHTFHRRFLVDDPDEARKHLLVHWNFENIAGNRCPDLSGKNLPCHLFNAKFEPFGAGQALSCGGLEAKTKGHGGILPNGQTISDALSISVWFKLGDKQHKGATGVVERPQFYRIMVMETQPPYSVSLSVQTKGGWRSAKTKRNLKPGEWIHLVATYDSEIGETAMYVNGKQVGKSSGQPAPIRPCSAGVDVGVRDGGAYLNGAIDEIRFYDCVLGPRAILPLTAPPNAE